MDELPAPRLSEIDAKRERLGVLQRDLCAEADVAESTLSRCRSAQREPREKIRRRLDHALDVIARRRGVAIIERKAG